MKKTLLLFSVFLSANFLFAQDDAAKTEIKTAFDGYFATLKSKDNTAAMDYIYPKLFDMVPKQMMIELMDQMYADTTMEIWFDNPQLQDISEIVKVEDGRYALVSYSFQMYIKLLEVDETEGEEESVIAMTHSMYNQMFGVENVKLLEGENTFSIFTENKLISINDELTEGWKFLEKNETMAPLLQQILPAEVLEKL